MVFITVIEDCLYACLNRNNIFGRIFLFQLNQTFLFFLKNTILERVIAVYVHIALHETWHVILYASNTQLGCHVNTGKGKIC